MNYPTIVNNAMPIISIPPPPATPVPNCAILFGIELIVAEHAQVGKQEAFDMGFAFDILTDAALAADGIGKILEQRFPVGIESHILHQ